MCNLEDVYKRQMLQISISSAISTAGRKALSIVLSVSRAPATGS